MTRDRIRRYIELDLERRERGRLDPTNATRTPREDEYQALDAEWEAWGGELVPDESAELKAVYDQLEADGSHYRDSLARQVASWEGICGYWHDRADRLEAELKALKGLP